MGIEQNNPERQAAIEEAISKMIWEGSPVLPVTESAVTQDQVLSVKNSSFPEVRGRTRFNPASEIAVSTDPLLRQP